MEYNLYRISPGTLAGIAIALVVSLLLAEVMRRRSAIPRGRSVWLALAAASAVASLLITLAPGGQRGTYPCAWTLEGSVFDWLRGNQSTANVALLMPLAVALPLATRATRWYAWSFVALIAFPVLIETAQRWLPVGRACDVADVVDNWFGVAFGCLLGRAGLAIASAVSSRARQPGGA